MKFKVLMAHNRYLIRGGEDESVDSQYRLLKSRGHYVELYEQDNKKVARIGLIKTGLNTIWSQQSARDVRMLIKKEKFDILDSQNTFPLISPSIYYEAKKAGIPVIQTLRNYRPLCPNALFYRDGGVCESCLNTSIQWPSIVHKCYRNSILGSSTVMLLNTANKILKTWENKVDLFVTLTNFAREKYIEGGFPKDRIVVKPNFVYPDPGMGEGKGNYALFVGRLTKEKGILTVLRAWRRLGRLMPLKIIGDGPLFGEVTKLVNEIPGVEYLGRKTAKEVYEIMGDAKVLIFPSEWYETFGRVAIEAYAKGTPVIASNIGAIAEIVKHKKTGLLFTPGDERDLEDKIQWVINNPLELKLMRSAARKEYLNKYTADKNYEMLIDIYEKATRLANK